MQAIARPHPLMGAGWIRLYRHRMQRVRALWANLTFHLRAFLSQTGNASAHAFGRNSPQRHTECRCAALELMDYPLRLTLGRGMRTCIRTRAAAGEIPRLASLARNGITYETLPGSITGRRNHDCVTGWRAPAGATGEALPMALRTMHPPTALHLRRLRMALRERQSPGSVTERRSHYWYRAGVPPRWRYREVTPR